VLRLKRARLSKDIARERLAARAAYLADRYTLIAVTEAEADRITAAFAGAPLLGTRGEEEARLAALLSGCSSALLTVEQANRITLARYPDGYQAAFCVVWNNIGDIIQAEENPRYDSFVWLGNALGDRCVEHSRDVDYLFECSNGCGRGSDGARSNGVREKRRLRMMAAADRLVCWWRAIACNPHMALGRRLLDLRFKAFV
jgi:hypothetical protein